MRIRVWEELENHIERLPWSGCWVWLLGTSNGYGAIRYNGSPKRAHRVAYEIYRGPIPDGLDALHTCDVRCCINPEHLYLGTDKQNARDRVVRNTIYQKIIETCPQGHDLLGNNAAWYRGHKYCRECKRIKYRDWYARIGRPNR